MGGKSGKVWKGHVPLTIINRTRDNRYYLRAGGTIVKLFDWGDNFSFSMVNPGHFKLDMKARAILACLLLGQTDLADELIDRLLEEWDYTEFKVVEDGGSGT